MHQITMDETNDGPILYHLGYEGRTPATMLESLREREISILCDVRLNPRSRVPHWNKGRLSASCEGADIHYEHVNALGNALYRSGGIELLDPLAGILTLIALMQEGKVAVMCMCKKVDVCHRAEVLRLAGETIYGLSVVAV